MAGNTNFLIDSVGCQAIGIKERAYDSNHD